MSREEVRRAAGMSSPSLILMGQKGRYLENIRPVCTGTCALSAMNEAPSLSSCTLPSR